MGDAVSERLLDYLFAAGPAEGEEDVEPSHYRHRSSGEQVQIVDLGIVNLEEKVREAEPQDWHEEVTGANMHVVFPGEMLGYKHEFDYNASEAIVERARVRVLRRHQFGFSSWKLTTPAPRDAYTYLLTAPEKDAAAPLQRFSAKAAKMLDRREVAELARALEEALEATHPAELHPALEGLEIEPLSVAERVVATTEGVGRRLGFEREQLAAAEGAEQTAARLEVSPEQLVEMRENGELVALESKPGEWRYPRWQFDAADSPRMLAGLPAVLQELGEMAPLARIAWLSSPKPALREGRSPLAALRAGEHDAVRRLARSASALAG